MKNENYEKNEGVNKKKEKKEKKKAHEGNRTKRVKMHKKSEKVENVYTRIAGRRMGIERTAGIGVAWQALSFRCCRQCGTRARNDFEKRKVIV